MTLHRPTLRVLATAATLALSLTACAGSAEPDDSGAPAVADDEALPVNDGDEVPITSGMCVEDEPDCEDMLVDPSGASCLEGDTECTDESYDEQDVASPVLLVDSSSEADVIRAGEADGAISRALLAVYSPDGTTLELTFSGGACDVLQDVLVTESDSEVRVLVLSGIEVGVDACTQQVVTWRTEVTLDAPLDGRELLDLAG